MQENSSSIALYQQLLADQSEEILAYLQNVATNETVAKFSEFNNTCYKNMYENNKEIHPRPFFFQDIGELETECKKCWKFFLNQRNQSIKGLDVQLGKKFEIVFAKYLKNRGIDVERGDLQDRKYPDYVISKNGKKIAYYELKYHQAPFVFTYKLRPGRECYEGSITMDHKKIETQLEIIKDLEVPVFYIHWVDFPCIKGIFCQSSKDVEEIIKEGIEYNRDEREGDFAKGRKVGHTEKFYPSLLKMMEFSEFLKIIKNLK